MKRGLKKINFIRFLKSNVAAAAATIVDFSVMTCSVELGKIYYPWAVVMGALAGAATNFWMNRTWTFRGPLPESQAAAHILEHPWGHQALKYSLVSGGSLVWNASGVFFLTETFGIVYWKSKILTAVLVGWFWNYPLHKIFVFRAKKVSLSHH
jgi:putative flippase GtrA